jgi:3-deoxy-D-manno-octulosonic-acid transferase
MILLFYNMALLVALVIGAPWWLFRMATTQKYREGLWERLGNVRPLRDHSGRPLIWIHAVSVGEVLAVSRLVERLDSESPDYFIAVSTTTRTGQALARERFGADRVFYCPLDLPWAVRAYLNARRPRLLVLAETEFWPNLLSACFRRGIPVAVVNARVSDRSWPRYRRLRRLWRPFLSKLTVVLAQSERDAERLRAIGCRPERVLVAGNLKFDVRVVGESEATRLLKSRTSGLRLVVAGSTLEGEEAALLEAWPRLLEADPQLALVLAPRHPERFQAVAELLDRCGVPWVRRSAWTGKPPELVAPLNGGQIVLLDTIGELASVYSIASVAFVGGSLVPAGGHNPLEPAQFGVPIVMGPHYANFRAITEDLLAQDAIRIAEKGTLAQVPLDLLCDRKTAKAMGERARQVFDQQAGATERCVLALKGLLNPPGSRHSIPRPVDPAIEREVRRLKNDGTGTEAILKFLRKNGCGKIDSIKILRSVYGIGLSQAKEIVDSSEVWKDRLGPDAMQHEELWLELERASQSPDSGIKANESGFVIRVSDDSEEG